MPHETPLFCALRYALPGMSYAVTKHSALYSLLCAVQSPALQLIITRLLLPVILFSFLPLLYLFTPNIFYALCRRSMCMHDFGIIKGKRWPAVCLLSVVLLYPAGPCSETDLIVLAYIWCYVSGAHSYIYDYYLLEQVLLPVWRTTTSFLQQYE